MGSPTLATTTAAMARIPGGRSTATPTPCTPIRPARLRRPHRPRRGARRATHRVSRRPRRTWTAPTSASSSWSITPTAIRTISMPTVTAAAARATPDALRELRPRALLALAVDEQVGSLGVEADEPGDALALRERGPVRPRDVVDTGAVDGRRPVLGDALVRAHRRRGRRLEEVEADVDLRQVPPRRQAGLDQHVGVGRLGQHHAVELDADRPG